MLLQLRPPTSRPLPLLHDSKAGRCDRMRVRRAKRMGLRDAGTRPNIRHLAATLMRLRTLCGEDAETVTPNQT